MVDSRSIRVKWNYINCYRWVWKKTQLTKFNPHTTTMKYINNFDNSFCFGILAYLMYLSRNFLAENATTSKIQ